MAKCARSGARQTGGNWQLQPPHTVRLTPACAMPGHHCLAGFVDADEYIILRADIPSLPALLERYEHHGGLALFSKTFGTSGHKTRPAVGTRQGFTKCAPPGKVCAVSIHALAAGRQGLTPCDKAMQLVACRQLHCLLHVAARGFSCAALASQRCCWQCSWVRCYPANSWQCCQKGSSNKSAVCIPLPLTG